MASPRPKPSWEVRSLIRWNGRYVAHRSAGIDLTWGRTSVPAHGGLRAAASADGEAAPDEPRFCVRQPEFLDVPGDLGLDHGGTSKRLA